MKKYLGPALAIFLASPSYADLGPQQHVALFVGIDVSGSFRKTGHSRDAMAFLAQYIHAHLKGIGGLEPSKSLFVGAIGGNSKSETKSFHPIEDFQGKSVAQINADLKEWFPRSDDLTDFNVFFQQVALIAQKRNLALTPIEIVLVTDGIPDMPGVTGSKISRIDVSPLEFLSRRVTLRLLYPKPTICTAWETQIPHTRLRIWTVDDQVMTGWSAQLKPGASPREQEDLWKWVLDNVDFRVRPVKFRVASKSK
jgi:hypothetical protein